MAFRTHHLLALAGLFVAPAAVAGPPPPKQPARAHAPAKPSAKVAPVAHREKPASSPGKSVGSPTQGKLIGGAKLSESDHVRVVPTYVPGDARWGLEALVNMLDRAARIVHKQYPDAQMSIGHLSRPGGGEINRHASHESGRDADVGFYVRNQRGKTIYADHFVQFKGDGTAATWPGAQFDDAKNWQLVSTFVSDPHAHVTHIFVASPIRARLLQYAEKIGAPERIRNLAAQLMAQPRGSLPHDDHFHVRVACPPGSTELARDKCVEIPLPHHHRGSHSALANTKNAKPKSPARAPAKPTPPPPPARRPEPKPEEAESKNDFVPSLAPSIPGLDSVLIPKLLPGAEPNPEPKTDGKTDSLEPLPPIDDPDGVFENR
ncbi:MAG: penicillin-insensitive murein endopeptidase [Labilithrix sp.]|nr:penicillin-insensitive murein endopeptidase [Labilithrix sp.]MCW5816209.1 penicillin-insensitive murein endopeptidase [Labilithrix sp.]